MGGTPNVSLKRKTGKVLSWSFRDPNDPSFVISEYESKGPAAISLWLRGLPAGEEITFHSIVEAAEKIGLSRGTAFRWKRQAESGGRLMLIGRGLYKRLGAPAGGRVS